MNAAWGTMQERDTVALNLTESHKTVKNIKARGAFTVSIADAAHVPEAVASKRSVLLTLKSSDMKVFSRGEYGESLFFINDGGYPTSQPRTRSYSSGSVYDQDGNVISWNYIYSLCEDLNGNVWMGTNNGVSMYNGKRIVSFRFSRGGGNEPNYVYDICEGDNHSI